MALEIKQQLKISQQLKMTPQLQQAIKLLQLSRMELVELVRQEMVENPVLEEGSEQQDSVTHASLVGEDRRSTDMALEGLDAEARPEVHHEVTNEVKGDGAQAVGEIDWDTYLEHHSLAPPMPGYRGGCGFYVVSAPALGPDETVRIAAVRWRG